MRKTLSYRRVRPLRTLVLAALAGSFSGSTNAQSDTTTSPAADSVGTPLPRPSIGLGTGMFAFYGDVGNDHAVYSHW